MADAKDKNAQQNAKLAKDTLQTQEKTLKALKYAAEAYADIGSSLTDILQKSVALNLRTTTQIDLAKQLNNIQSKIEPDQKKRLLSESLIANATKLQNIQAKQAYDTLKKNIIESGKLKQYNEELIELYAVRNQFESAYDDALKSTADRYNTLIQLGIDRNTNEDAFGEIIKSHIAEYGDWIDDTIVQLDLEEQLNKKAEELFANDAEKLKLAKEQIESLKKQSLTQTVLYSTQKQITDELIKNAKAQMHANELANHKKNFDVAILNILGEQGEEIKHIGHLLKEAFTSPLAFAIGLLSLAVDEFINIGKTSREFLNTTGLTVDQTEHLRHEAHDLSLELRDQGVQMKDVFDAQSALLNQFGSINRVSDETTKTVVQLGKAFGIAAESSAGVIYNIQKATGVSAEVAGNVAALGANFAKAAGVAPNEVFKDIANSSEQIAQYFKGTPADLMRTAVEARRLGLNIAKVADISKALLSFESSIEDQMTASVLLGREINLDKARQLAMEGKIQEAAEETLKQVGSLADFNKMNAVQKEAIAKAAGMTVGDLQQSLEKQEAIKNMSAAQRAEYEKGLAALKGQNMSMAEKMLKDQKNQLTQEKIADAVAKISEIFANVILPVLEPIFDLISGIFSVISPALPLLKTALQIFLGWKVAMFAISKIRLIDFKALGNGLKGLFTGDTWKAGWKKITGFISADWKKATGKLPAPEIEEKPGGFFDTIKKFFNSIKDKTSEVVKEPTEDITEKLQDKVTGKGEEIVGEKIDSKVEDLQGKAEEKGTELISKTTDKTSDIAEKGAEADKVSGGSKAGEGIKTFFTNLAEGLKAMGQDGVGKGVFNTLVAGPALLIFTAAIPGLIAVSLFGKVAGKGLEGLAKGIKFMGNPEVFKGALGIAAVGASIIPAALAFKLLEGVDASSILAFTVSILALTAATIPMGALVSTGVLELAAIGFALLGASMIPLAGALNIAAPAIETTSNSLQTLISNVGVDSLFSIGAGLMSVAAGLGAVGLAGALALPTLTGLALLTPALKVLDSIFGSAAAESKPISKPTGGVDTEKVESPSADTQLLLDKMDQLISAITSAGEIKLDAKKVGEVLAINTVRNYKISS